ncbi:MAG: excinuclease ABC subunit UvrC, partial [Ketobacter sp.]
MINIDAFLKSLTTHPGVYRMIGADDQVLYVGKAKNLKNRVSSYFRGRQQSPKTVALVEKIERIEVTVTNSETEALLLEQTLIKSLKPPFNILLRDDKSYPYIYLSQQDFPRLAYYRGSKKLPGRFFGPYPSAAAVRETLNLLQKIFNVRQCEDSFYRNRSRPCLQHQIERCKAPCVGLVSEEEYAEDVRHTIMFLEGKSSEVRKELTASMEAAAAELQFERAAQFRDQLEALT